MEARVDYVTSRLEEDEEASLWCMMCGFHKPASQMGGFNCLECEGVVATRDAEVEELMKQFDYILEREGDNGKGKVRVSRVGSSAGDDDTGGPRISYGPLFD